MRKGLFLEMTVVSYSVHFLDEEVLWDMKSAPARSQILSELKGFALSFVYQQHRSQCSRTRDSNNKLRCHLTSNLATKKLHLLQCKIR